MCLLYQYLDYITITNKTDMEQANSKVPILDFLMLFCSIDSNLLIGDNIELYVEKSRMTARISY